MNGSGKQGAVFRRMVEDHLDFVHSVARRVTGNTEAARDVAQTVFLKLHRKHSSIPADLPLTAWLHRETHSASVNHEKLPEILRGRGITTTASLLAITLPGHAVEKCPDSIVIAIRNTPPPRFSPHSSS